VRTFFAPEALIAARERPYSELLEVLALCTCTQPMRMIADRCILAVAFVTDAAVWGPDSQQLRGQTRGSPMMGAVIVVWLLMTAYAALVAGYIVWRILYWYSSSWWRSGFRSSEGGGSRNDRSLSTDPSRQISPALAEGE
jgi:hypothetical protein